ncbi:hypothetical protein ALP33_00200 [Pseudomonas amygdali pv. lachrymans]|uniref:DUF306 domain-containing protein n=3 Tax=Pseudomonas amygdali pv. lachrymans TaxID=53707 RepID=A0AB37R746_PSEAV|nr:hypothetical protein ALQ79_03079 [Pseudomonas amygdali pv. lachrymans]RMT17692.1 hypothetical protein ALP54_02768 [Pseudomonas amygdali pv. lachrymans]RMU21137.1 hypothetical protein ALP33_00200 [Pseudomonas amygdali pv. lachrymans]RMV57520.1 hypothetical protein ALP09_02057 [Pseudomonas amygdali pv. lachrymans]
MVEHDFRYSMLNPQHTLTECRTLAPGRYQVTGNGGSIHDNDQLLVTIKGSKSLHMRLTVEKVRHLINPPGQWIAVAKGPVFDELAIHQWKVNCDSCRVHGREQAGRQGAKTCRHRAHRGAGLENRRREAPLQEVPGESGMKQFALLSLIGGALLAGCTADPLSIQQDHSYVTEWIGERPLIDNSRLTMTLGADGRAYGNAGCNHWFAPYTLNDHSISFGPVGKTRKMCAPALMEQEQRFIKSISSVQRWDISPIEQLRLWPAQGKPLRFWLEDS